MSSFFAQGRVWTLLMLFSLVFVMGCGGGGDATPVIGAPNIVSQPQSQTIAPGGSTTLQVGATGSDLRYQWYFNGTPISGAIGASYTISNASQANAGNYTVVVSNAGGSVTSSTAILTVQAGGTAAAQVVVTGLIPTASQSITVAFLQGNTTVQSKTVAAPAGDQTTVSFTNLPAGTLTARATAHPNVDGSGTAQARATETVTLVEGGENRIVLSMATTISLLNVSPATANVGIGGTRSFTVVAYNASGAIVQVDPSTFTWSSSNTGRATVNGNGVVTGVSAGTVTITATDQETGLSASATVTVAPGTGDVIVIVR